MSKVISIEFDTKGLSPNALKVLKAAITIALRAVGVQRNHVAQADFYELAGLPATIGMPQLIRLFTEARNVTGFGEIKDAGSDDDDGLLGSWPVFNSIFVTGTHISFGITDPMYQPEVHSLLLGDTPAPVATKAGIRSRCESRFSQALEELRRSQHGSSTSDS
ncbi:hypothetical protein [Burkholderia sp. Bp9004]|uniref:hypothetical protein n=1 Tax=Burkholderia sp. Bp9004 TaxID=2184559 RepID=UPI000F5E542A|nr:hypothetical protein [Burkholderia sp. Bp9004]RQZ59316.1 hypothetical protein DIE08_32415 [Burkholderia sp. Bp9004]